ncbi:MAG TPA: ribosome-associated translation inhibitor RaiA [Alphaproteobacteria bacterium]|nr:ribosome-associated translation inhibitor RaiA [Alphaproteobacteria bacterium]
MEIKVAGVHFQVGESLTQHCEEKLADLKKYSVNAVSTDVTFSNSTANSDVNAEVVIKTAGLTVRSTGFNQDAYTAFEEAYTKAEKQVAKYKERMKKHNRRREESIKFAELPVLEAQKSVISEESLADAPDDMFAEFLPKIEHKEVKNIQTLTVDEAVMQMDLLHVNFFIFQNAKTEQLNIVYREQDDSNKIGWIEPKQA